MDYGAHATIYDHRFFSVLPNSCLSQSVRQLFRNDVRVTNNRLLSKGETNVRIAR